MYSKQEDIGVPASEEIAISEQELANYPGEPHNPLRPFIPPDPLMAGPWVAALSAALDNGPMMEAFREDTELSWIAPKSGLDRMIDEATGADSHYLVKFAEWFNLNVWGDPRLDSEGCIDGVKQPEPALQTGAKA